MDNWHHKEIGFILSMFHNQLEAKGYKLIHVHEEKECVGMEYSKHFGFKKLTFQLAPSTDLLLRSDFSKKHLSVADSLQLSQPIYDIEKFWEKALNFLIDRRII